MISPVLADKIRAHLFDSEKDFEAGGVAQTVRARVVRVRHMLLAREADVNRADSDILEEARALYPDARPAVLYEEYALARRLLGDMKDTTRAYHRYIFLERLEEGFHMAREKDDVKAFAQLLATYGKYTRLDAEEVRAADYSSITPQTFEITADHSAAGVEDAEKLIERAKKLEAQYLKQEGEV